MSARRAALCCSLAAVAAAQPTAFDDRPGDAGEWGFRPADGAVTARTPPPFTWRPQPDAARYELQVAEAADESFAAPLWTATDLALPAHCPSATMPPGGRRWRVRAIRADGSATAWSRSRTFTMPADATPFALPARDELLARVPEAHPRLFVRPEQRASLRAAAEGELASAYAALVARCDDILRHLPDTSEPPRYPEGTERESEAWREIWWGNRLRTVAVLDAAAQLAFAAWLADRDDFAAAAERLLLAAAAWDPKGATGYRYNDEAGMPYAYHFSRAYTFLHHRLDAAARERCRAVMRVRGREMYRHLCPNHLWRPFSSHSNRAWHFLGEVAIAFRGEIAEADDWLWFAANVFATAYPVWSDDDGGWHEGYAYWRSYLSRFTWWADVQRAALGLDAYRLPFFACAGDFALYVTPPGAHGAGFGDLCGHLESRHGVELMRVLARQAAQPHWQWWVEQHGEAPIASHYVDFLRAALPAPPAQPPAALPSSRLFAGTGVAALHTDLLAAADDVAVLFKSSPFGSQSHGYDAQNSFVLYAFGERLLVRSGRRDLYGSEHHRGWMWQTRSVNAISVDGEGQTAHSAKARGRITGFDTSADLDWVQGDAREAYGGRVEQATRDLLLCKPDLLIVLDRLRAPQPARFTAHLHAAFPMQVEGDAATVEGERSACRIALGASTPLALRYTDRFDPPPRPRVKLTQYHLDATTEPAPAALLATVVQVRRHGAEAPAAATIERDGDALSVRAPWRDGEAAVRLTEAGIEVELRAASGEPIRRTLR